MRNRKRSALNKPRPTGCGTRPVPTWPITVWICATCAITWDMSRLARPTLTCTPPTMLGCPDLRDEARHSVSEHKEIDDKLGELVQTDMDSSSWMEAFGELQHRYLHHIEEEEEEMFPKASEGLTSEAEERIAKIFERRKPRERQRATQEMPGDERE